jgi:hypothetical protein
MLNRVGHYLPGLRSAEPTWFIVIGLLILTAHAAASFVVRERKARFRLALAASCAWTAACALTFLDNAVASGFVGQTSSARASLMYVVLPAYLVGGLCTVWAGYGLAATLLKERGKERDVKVFGGRH